MSGENLQKRCGRCKLVKLLEEFGKVKGRHRSYCRPCHRSADFNTDFRTEKKCARCKEVKEIKEFARLGRRYQSYCRECQCFLGRQRHEKDKREGTASIKCKVDYLKRGKWARLLKERGITKDEYELLVVLQEGRCAICNQPETQIYRGEILRLTVDHDHITGKLRRLLCKACNMGLGLFGDDPERLQKAADYIRQHRAESPELE